MFAMQRRCSIGLTGTAAAGATECDSADDILCRAFCAAHLPTNRALTILEVALDGFTETLRIAYRLAGIVASWVALLCCHLKVALKNLPPGQESVAKLPAPASRLSELVFLPSISDSLLPVAI